MSLEIQQMIRDQANETRDELAKMVSWEAEIQERDNKLIELAKQGKVGYEQPNPNRPNASTPVASKPVKVPIKTDAPKKTEEPVQSSSKKTKAPLSYEEWSKLDAKLKEEDLDTIDDDPKITAEDHKNKGNEYFKKKKFDMAIKEYTTASRLDPSNAVYYYNRATAYSQISEFQECERDATKAISLDPRYTKAFIRRGLCRKSQGKLEIALQDFEEANKLESGLPIVDTNLQEIRKQLGILPSGKIQVLEEPKVSIVEETTEAPRPKFEVISETNAEEPQKPKVEEIKKPKIEVVEEREETHEEFKRRPKVEVISEKTLYPEPMETPPHKVEEVKKPKIEEVPPEEAPRKIPIVVEEQPEPTPGKVQIITEEEPDPVVNKVKIVAEEEESKPKPVKVSIVNEDVDSSELQTIGDIAPKKAKRPDNIKVEVEGLDTPRNEAPSKKPKKIRKNFGPWITMSPELYAERMEFIEPAKFNKELGTDIDIEHVISNIINVLATYPPDRAYEYVEQMSRNKFIIALRLSRNEQVSNSLKEMVSHSTASEEKKQEVLTKLRLI